jgi:hypothetical protein
MKKLPLGIQSFEKIKTDPYLYIDKTQQALTMAEQGTYYFLSRPRRFGKSLFLDTLKCLFEGRKDRYATICGYTQMDVETGFKEHLDRTGPSGPVDLAELAKWYYE